MFGNVSVWMDGWIIHDHKIFTFPFLKEKLICRTQKVVLHLCTLIKFDVAVLLSLFC